MKLNTYLKRSLLLLLCLMVTGVARSQETKKPGIVSSANARTVYKPSEETQKTEKSVKQTSSKKNAATSQKAKSATKKEAAGSRKGKSAAGNRKKSTAATVERPDARQRKKTTTDSSSRYIALKTNVPFLVVVVQNMALEIQLQKHLTLDLPVMWSISDIEREHALRTIAFQPEIRWWPKAAGKGHFFGVHAHAAWFNAKWENNRYQTEKRPLLGAGVSYGYKLPLSSHWGVEFNLGVGYANMQYNTYYNIENGARIDTRKRNYWGITRMGISLVYRF